MKTAIIDDFPQSSTVDWFLPLSYALVGLLLGIFIQNIDWIYQDDNVPNSWVGLQLPISIALYVFFPTMLLLWHSGKGMAAPIYLIIMLALAVWAGSQVLTEAHASTDSSLIIYTASTNLMGVFFPLGLMALVTITLPFVQAWRSHAYPRWPYESLFSYAWNNLHIVVLAALFASVFYLVIQVGISLFGSLHPDSTASLNMERLIPLILLMGFGAGMGILQQFSSILLRLYTLVFVLYHLLAYIAALIVISFAGVLVFSWHSFYQNKETTPILLFLVAVSLVLLNALVDRRSDTLPKWANILFGIQITILPFLTLLTSYVIFRQVKEFGLSPGRMLGLIACVILLAYTITYLVQLIRLRTNWSDGFKHANPALAIFTAFIIFLTLTPVLDPQRWSTQNQLNRLKNGIADAQLFDYHNVRYEFGRPGKQAFAEMATWTDHPSFAVISSQMQQAQAAGTPEVSSPANLEKVHILPQGKKVDLARFSERLLQLNNIEIGSEHCLFSGNKSSATDCYLLYKDINGDGKEEAIFFQFNEDHSNNDAPYQVYAQTLILDSEGMPLKGRSLQNAEEKVVHKKDETYSEIVYDKMTKQDYEQMIVAVRTGHVFPAMPRLPDIMLGNVRLREPY